MILAVVWPAPRGNRPAPRPLPAQLGTKESTAETRHGKSLAAIEPVIHQGGQGVGKAEVRPDGDHQQIKSRQRPRGW